MTRTTALAIYDVLVREAGARAHHRAQFVEYFIADDAGPKEFRFMGTLGGGGKCRLTGGMEVSVDCYPEDETHERMATIKRTNSEIKRVLAMRATQWI